MSVVKDTLRQQDASFISLREVLELLTKDGEGCTLHDAAVFLSQKLRERDAPAMLHRNSITRERYRTAQVKQLALLVKIINPVDLEDEVPF